MRQSHQKSRSRGRNRKPQNPMSRNYESNGPDVKIRGNAGHIAEKYSTLARDALSNGDTVMAENYLQHAEHYNRVIAAAQAQKAEENAANAAHAAANGRGPQPDTGDGNQNASQEQESGVEAAAETAAPEETAEKPKERKSNRGRRTKPVATEAEAQPQATSDQQPETANGSTEAASADADEISDDAASLPQSITGGLRVEETQ